MSIARRGFLATVIGFLSAPFATRKNTIPQIGEWDKERHFMWSATPIPPKNILQFRSTADIEAFNAVGRVLSASVPCVIDQSHFVSQEAFENWWDQYKFSLTKSSNKTST